MGTNYPAGAGAKSPVQTMKELYAAGVRGGAAPSANRPTLQGPGGEYHMAAGAPGQTPGAQRALGSIQGGPVSTHLSGVGNLNRALSSAVGGAAGGFSGSRTGRGAATPSAISMAGGPYGSLQTGAGRGGSGLGLGPVGGAVSAVAGNAASGLSKGTGRILGAPAAAGKKIGGSGVVQALK